MRGSRRPADRAALRRGVLRPSSRCAAGIACRLGAGVPPPHWRDWLAAPGSLTARVRRHGARFEVRVLDQGDAAWLPDERDALRPERPRGAAHAREVALCLDGVPVVLARSVIDPAVLRGPWQALFGLGTRPLAELLFEDRRMRRSPLSIERIGRAGPLRRRIERLARRAGLGPVTGLGAEPLWARSSVFERHGARLRVMEVFLPALLGRSDRAVGRRGGDLPSDVALTPR